MGSQFEKNLADENNQILYKQKVAGVSIEVVDVNLVPVVKAAGMGKKAEFPLERLGMLYSDGDEKFILEASGEEVKPGELNDLVVEALLFGLPAEDQN